MCHRIAALLRFGTTPKSCVLGGSRCARALDIMLRTSKRERENVISYVEDQAADETVTLAQKVYSERVHTVKHDIWDVHTDKDRWWVITNPTNLYSQAQFPNMDLALTFHIGLCIRMPRAERDSLETEAG